MTFRLLLLFSLTLFFSCTSEAPEEEKTEGITEEEKADLENAKFQRKATDALNKDKINIQNNSSHNEGFVMATQPDMKVDQEKFKNVLKNAVKGDPDYQYSLAMCYKYGYAVKPDTKKALFWFKKAADQGHKQAERVYNFMIKRK